MNIPFPIIYPTMIGPDWFNADPPCDEDAELTKLEQENQQWLNSIAKKYIKATPVEKPNPEPMEETGSDDDANDDDAEESEESHDVDEEDEIPTTTTTESSQINMNEVGTESPEENTEGADLETETALWPYVAENE